MVGVVGENMRVHREPHREPGSEPSLRRIKKEEES